MFAKYTPIIPKNNIIRPPKNEIETITDVHPSIPIPLNIFIYIRYIIYDKERVVILNPKLNTSHKGLDEEEVIT